MGCAGEPRPQQPAAPTSGAPASGGLGQEGSWRRNLLFLPPSGFWSDAAWYDLQMERRIPETASALRELVWALPPLSGGRVADFGSGGGRLSLALAAAYPSARLTLLDVDEERGQLALGRLRRQAQELGEEGAAADARFLRCALAADGSRLPGARDEGSEGYDCVVALQAVRHVVAPAPHYASKHGLPVVQGEAAVREGYRRLLRGLFDSLVPGGHIFIGDHAVHNHPGVFEHCQLLLEAGFTDVDVAWRVKDWFVVGARKPLAE